MTSEPPSDSETRFVGLSTDQFNNLLNNRLPPNTVKNLKSSAKTFYDWRRARTDEILAGESPDKKEMWMKELHELSDKDLCEQLARFVTEIRMKNGQPYIGRTLVQNVDNIASLIKNMIGRSICWKSNPEFVLLKSALDAVVRASPMPKQPASAISIVQEKQLWNCKGTGFGRANAFQLHRTLLFKIGIHTGCRGASELRNLRFSCFSIVDTEAGQCLRIAFLPGKTTTPSLRNLNPQQKVVLVYPTEPSEESLFDLYRFYVSKIDYEGVKDANFFFARPLAMPTQAGFWFSQQPVGLHTLEKTVKHLFDDNGLDSTNISNRSLRVTSATRLVANNESEHSVKQLTGHQSSVVRRYIRPNDSDSKRRALILAGSSIEKTTEVASTSAGQSVPAPSSVSSLAISTGSGAVLSADDEAIDDSNISSAPSINATGANFTCPAGSFSMVVSPDGTIRIDFKKA